MHVADLQMNPPQRVRHMPLVQKLIDGRDFLAENPPSHQHHHLRQWAQGRHGPKAVLYAMGLIHLRCPDAWLLLAAGMGGGGPIDP